MGELGVLISGSFAVQFFERVTWPSSDLDLYVKDGEESEALCAYLVESEGYALQTTKGPAGFFGYAMYNFVNIWKYVRPVLGSPDHFTDIHVITASSIPIHAILNSFYTTVVVNIITWNKAYSVYPLTTFVQKRGYLLKPLNDYFTSLMLKYTKRGWKIQETMWPEDEGLSHPIQQYRRIGDQYTWTIPLDTSKISWSRIPDAVLEHAAFELSRTPRPQEGVYPDNTGPSFYEITAFVFKSHALQYMYTHHYDWSLFLGERVRQMTGFELRKLKVIDRPPNYQQMVEEGFNQSHKQIINKPDTWTFWDSEIPKWYKAWEKIALAEKAKG